MSATKKQIFLDVDGVLLNFHKSFAWFLEERYSFKSNNTEIAHTDSLIKHAEKNVEFSELAEKLKDRTVIYDFWASKYFSILESFVDISSYNQVAEKYPIYLVSNLPNNQKKSRTENLALRGFKYQNIFFAGFDNYGEPNYPLKSEIILQEAKKDAEIIFLDDLTINCKDIKQTIPNARVFLLDKSYNRKEKLPEGCIRVADWEEFKSLI